MLKRVQLVVLILLPSLLFAGGFQVNLQGARELGMGHCGLTLKQSSTSVFFNPGSMALLDSNYASIFASAVIPKVNYLATYPSTYTASMTSGVGTPFNVNAAFRLKPEGKINVGLAVYTPFGSGISYADDWLGKFVVREMSLRAIFFQPTVGYKITDDLGIGIGYTRVSGTFFLRKAIPIQDENEEYGEARLSGKGVGHGFNVGVNYSGIDKLTIGISYRSNVAVKVDSGDASFDVVPYLADSFPQTKFSTKLTLPQVANLGVSYQLTEKLLLAAEFNYVGWKVYDTLSFDFEDNSELLEDVNSPRKYTNSYIVRLGLESKLKDNLAVRLGAYFDKSPLKDDFITPEAPDSDKLGLTGGIGYSINNKVFIDIACLYITGKKRTAINKETEFGGTWKTSAWVPSLGLQYQF